jgi:type IV pilus assembly protein PilZ
VDKRQYKRVSVKILVLCELEGAPVINGLATNLSLGGSRIESAEVPAFGSQLTIVARIPGEKELSRLPGTVRWTAPSSFGVQFGLLGAKDTYRIANLMRQSAHSD